jgi:RNA polymerase sigma-70 factor (ECF subfamily)
MTTELQTYQQLLSARNTVARRAFETELVERAIAGNPSAFRVIADAHRDRMFRVAIRVVKNEEDANDVVQDVMVTIHRKLNLFHGNSDLGTWIHRVTVNTALMSLRRNARFNKHVGEEILETVATDDVQREIENRDELRMIQEAWGRVSEKHREALYLRVVEDETVEDIASTLGVSVAAAKSRIHRARLELQTLLAA